MKARCKEVRHTLLDMAYPADGGGTGVGAGADRLQAPRDVAEHLQDCAGCRDFAGALVDAAVVLGPPVDLREGAASDAGVPGVAPDWARLRATMNRAVKLRAARQRRAAARFALVAAGVLAAAWVPLASWGMWAIVLLQAAGFFGIALFYLPIHVLRERRGDHA